MSKNKKERELSAINTELKTLENNIKSIDNGFVDEAVKKREIINFKKIIINRNSKDNQNRNYILNKLEPNNYNLLYDLINNLFDEKLSEKSKEKFQEYLSKEENPDKKRHIMKILKSVYRLKYNNSIEKKRKERIIENAESLKGIKKIISTNTEIQKKIKQNKNKNKNETSNLEEKLKNQLQKYKISILANVKDISSHIDLATSFHNFSKKTYYICNSQQLKKNYNVADITTLSEDQIRIFSPIIIQNGITCFNPVIKKITANKEGLNQGLKDVISKNEESKNKKNTHLEIVPVESINTKSKKFINIDLMIENIDMFNHKNSILSKFFDKHIFGIANEHGIKSNNKKNIDSEINSYNFDVFCGEFKDLIDTIIVIEDGIVRNGVKKNGVVTFTHTKTRNTKGKEILKPYFKIKNEREYLNPLLLLLCIIPLFYSLKACYNSEDTGNTTIIKVQDYAVCVVLTTFSIMLILLAIAFAIYMTVQLLGAPIFIAGSMMSKGSSSSSSTSKNDSKNGNNSSSTFKFGSITDKDSGSKTWWRVGRNNYFPNN